jgi:hypothetical protein
MGSIPGWAISLLKSKNAEAWAKILNYMEKSVLPKRKLEPVVAPAEPKTVPPAVGHMELHVSPSIDAVVERAEAQEAKSSAVAEVRKPSKPKRRAIQVEDESESEEEGEKYYDAWTFDEPTKKTMESVEKLLQGLQVNLAVLNERYVGDHFWRLK